MTDWRTDAACRGVDPEVFHPTRGDNAGFAAAITICANCPVATECLTYALDTKQVYGVWGGTSSRDRRILARTWRRTVACDRCGTRVTAETQFPPKYCETCRPLARTDGIRKSARTANYDPKRCPVCTCEFVGGRDCCSPLCARVFRRRQVAS